MLSLMEPTVYEKSKCFFTYGRLAHLDPEQLPTAWKNKGKPWSSILANDFVRRVFLIAIHHLNETTHVDQLLG